MSTKNRGNSRDEQWRDRQREKQRQRKEADEAARAARQEEPQSQAGAQPDVSGEGNPTESGEPAEAPLS